MSSVVKKKAFNLLMPHSLFEEIRQHAKKDAVSINQFILFAVIREIEKRNQMENSQQNVNNAV